MRSYGEVTNEVEKLYHAGKMAAAALRWVLGEAEDSCEIS